MGKHHHWEHHVIGPVSTNCYIFGPTDEAIMVDPGGPEAEKIARKLLEQEIEIKHVLVTHGHFDHLGWAPDVLKVSEGAKVYLHEGEKDTLEIFLERMAQYMGMAPFEIREPDVWLHSNQELELSGYKFKVIHSPGHSPGSATFDLISSPEGSPPLISGKSAIVGDVIFQGSIGRFDLPFSDGNQMQETLKMLMDELHEGSHILPGHGGLTTMADELQSNPYLLAIKQGMNIF